MDPARRHRGQPHSTTKVLGTVCSLPASPTCAGSPAVCWDGAELSGNARRPPPQTTVPHRGGQWCREPTARPCNRPRLRSVEKQQDKTRRPVSGVGWVEAGESLGRARHGHWQGALAVLVRAEQDCSLKQPPAMLGETGCAARRSAAHSRQRGIHAGLHCRATLPPPGPFPSWFPPPRHMLKATFPRRASGMGRFCYLPGSASQAVTGCA